MLDSIRATFNDACRAIRQKEVVIWRWKSPSGVFGVPWVSIRWGKSPGIRFPANGRQAIQRAKAAA